MIKRRLLVKYGRNSINNLPKLKKMSNAICIVGNHELMVLDDLRFLNSTIATKSVDSIDVELLGNHIDW